MATNPLLVLSGQTPVTKFSNVLTNIENIERQRQAQAQAPARQQLLEAQAGIAQSQVPTDIERHNQQERAFASSIADISRQIVPDLETGNTEAAISKLQARAQSLEAAGISSQNTLDAIGLARNNPDELLRASKNAIEVDRILNPRQQVSAQFGAQQTFKDSKGNLFFGTQVRDPSKGTARTTLTPIGDVKEPIGDVSLVSGLGQTAAEKQATTIATEKGKEAAKLGEQAITKPVIASRVETAKTQAERQQAQIDSGIDSADATANIRRALDLIKQVPTGGIDAVSLRAKQIFGVEGADEAELSSRLGKAVLSQLRATFGAAFTEREGARLANIEAGFGKSTTGNERLLQQTLKILDRSARRGMKAARASGDEQSIADIQEALEFRLEAAPVTQPQQQAAPQTVQPQQGAPQVTEGQTATNPQTGQRIIFTNGQWQPAP